MTEAWTCPRCAKQGAPSPVNNVCPACHDVIMHDLNSQRVLEESRRFRAALTDLLPRYDGRWVVFRDGAVQSDHDNEETAYVAGVTRFGVRGGFVIARVWAGANDPVHVRW